MNSEVTPSAMTLSHEGETNPSGSSAAAGQKKPFVPPELIRHDSLPAVTTGFFGTFSP
jgi:hypothetical protein